MTDSSYELEFTANADRDLRRLDRDDARRIITKLRFAAQTATTGRHKALKGEWSPLYSLRIGDYRAIYALYHEEHVMVVERIGHRREIYDE